MRNSNLRYVVIAIVLIGLLVALHFWSKTEPTITGIGVALAPKGSAIEIMGVVPNTPAANAGLRRGSHILRIDGTDTVGKSLKECVELTRGPVGSKVQLEIFEPESNETNVVTFIRAKILSPSVNSAIHEKPVPR
jgi:carboxyl-terminal processing protease